jgi:hypothetical protein
VATELVASRVVLSSIQIIDFSGLFSIVALKVYSVGMLGVEGEESYHILAF